MNASDGTRFLQAMLASSPLFGGNNAYVESLYEDYLNDAGSVPPAWRALFDQWQAAGGQKDVAHGPIRAHFLRAASAPASPATAEAMCKQAAVLQLINAYRFLGLRAANLDPLQRNPPAKVEELEPAYYGLSEADMDCTFNTDFIVGGARMTLREILQRLRRIYCSTVGAEYMYLSSVTQKRWIQARLEREGGVITYSPATQQYILEKLTAAEGLERYLHTKYAGQKRFSLEGSETLIPLLDHLLQRAGAHGVQEVVIGMAHRGRLNVLVNILGKLPRELFAEFEEVHKESLGSGDVKYHQGFSSDIATPGGAMHLALAFNPSHLEIVNPVVQGSVRARQHRRRDLQGNQVIPILLHGDAAFAGQGVNQETLNLAQTRGFCTGGTVHIVINNQIGFTTSDPRDVRSSQYCTDVAKIIEAPIFHVNADDPEAVLWVAEIALDFRMRFHKDVVIDMVCFRRLGHNEQDDPMVTQPLMYRKIKQHPGTRALYAKRLVEQGVISAKTPQEMMRAYRAMLDEGHNPVRPVLTNFKHKFTAGWRKYRGNIPWTTPAKTHLSRQRLQHLAQRLTEVPPNFKLHPRVEKIIADRRAMGNGELPLDWGMAENLAYASLLEEGYPVRLSGQDCGRGAFFHRHAVWHNQNRQHWDKDEYIPLQHISPEQADFAVIDSILSEEAVLAFEYGYATAEPDALTLWEAQFGDFANGAQVVIDQFIASGEAKWGRLCGLVMLLPHGYEGQGPEHSSGRIERYLQLCAEYNIQVCIPSNAAQIFHLLRRQILRPYRKPLIVFTPKSLLRSKEASSPLEDFTQGQFQPVIAETDALDADKVRRIIVCSGKVYYDLIKGRSERNITDMAIIRIEQLYPFPHDDFAAQIAAYPQATEVLWCQEEPGNQGAWHRIQHYLLRHMRPDMKLGYALRPSSASPAAGYLSVHQAQQKAVIAAAFRPDLEIKNRPGAIHEHR